MKEIVPNKELVSYCGLYCGACKKYLNEKCPGCHENSKASWCKIRVCCMQSGYLSCADCKEFTNPADCKKFNNFMSKLFSLIFKSDRAGCIEQIRNIGIEGHAIKMAELKLPSIKK